MIRGTAIIVTMVALVFMQTGCGGIRSVYDQVIDVTNDSGTVLTISYVCNRYGKGRISRLAVGGGRGYYPRPVRKNENEELRVYREGSEEVLSYPYRLVGDFSRAKRLIYRIRDDMRLELKYYEDGSYSDEVLVIDPIIVSDRLKCPMHPEATVGVDGKCMVCGMDGIDPPEG